MAMKRLRRSDSNRVFAGVLGGLGDYFAIDPVLFRVLFLFLVLVTGIFPGVIAYFLAIMVMPSEQQPVVHEHQEPQERE